MGLRLIWHSNAAWAGSGYGQQTLLTCKRIQKMPEVEQLLVSTFYGLHGGIVEYEDLIHLPPHGQNWGNEAIQLHSYHTKSDVVITLVDAWVMRKDISQLGFIYAPYFPVDHEPLPTAVWEKVQDSYMPITMSKSAFEICKNLHQNTRYAPHMVETKLYKPHSHEKNMEERRKLNIPEDAFLVGIVAANKGFPSRKAWPQLLEAFAIFSKRHSDAILYAHTLINAEHDGIDMPSVINTLGIGNKVVIPNPYHYHQSFPMKEMSRIYSCFDVFLLPSMGEGFGVPIIESQSCGVPVIVTDFTAMPELVAPETGAKISVAYKWLTPLLSYQALPNIGEIVDALEYYYSMSTSKRKTEGKKARKFVVDNYDANLVAEKHWKPIVQDLAELTEIKTFKLYT